jgi:hypothetical protein
MKHAYAITRIVEHDETPDCGVRFRMPAQLSDKAIEGVG